MNRKIGMAGSIFTGISVICFAACMLLNFDFGSYLVCMFLAIGYLMMISAFYSECDPGKKSAGSLSLAFAAIYAVIILLVYFAQTTAVRLNSLNDMAMQILDYGRFGLFFSYDLLGYGIMALSTFFIGLTITVISKKDKALRALMVIHGVFFISCFIMPMLGVFSSSTPGIDWMGTLVLEIWCAYFLPVTVLSFLHFKHAE